MNTHLSKVEKEERGILLNLVKMYCYEWSQYNGIEVDQNGEFPFEHHLYSFWKQETHFPFFIKCDSKLAGFVLVDNDFDYKKDSDHAISEFFVMYKYRRSGIGKAAAINIFDLLPGKWEIKMHPSNEISINFWKNVVKEVTNNKYDYIEKCKTAKYQDGSLGTIIVFNNEK